MSSARLLWPFGTAAFLCPDQLEGGILGSRWQPPGKPPSPPPSLPYEAQEGPEPSGQAHAVFGGRSSPSSFSRGLTLPSENLHL